jgi:serine/threonine protein kinase
MVSLEGRTLDRYQLQKLLGKGGMADVYRAYDTQFTRHVAIKVFQREDEALLRRFVREARMMAALHHPHLIPVYDAGTSQVDGSNFYYIVMPIMEGGNLRSVIQRGPLSLQAAYRYLSEISDALDYIHRQGVIHRDIKTLNVLLDKEGRCYLSDFGIARATTDVTQLTSTGSFLGTVVYMAPELFDAKPQATTRSDLYALGVLLFEMLTGRFPFTAESQVAVMSMHVHQSPPAPSQMVPGIPVAVDQVILKAMDKQPALRYSSAAELTEAFGLAIAMPQTPMARMTHSLPPTVDAPTYVEPRAYSQARGQVSLSANEQVVSEEHIATTMLATDKEERAVSERILRSPQRKLKGSMIALVLIAALVLLTSVGYGLYTYIPLRNASQTGTVTSSLLSTTVLPQAGTINYTVQAGDQCDTILSTQMHFAAATQVFNDAKPVTIQALNTSLGHNCDRLQPGLVLPLSPQYPLVAIQGKVVKIEALDSEQTVQDCTGACRLVVDLAQQAQVQVAVQKTALSVHINSVIWAQARMARQPVKGFDTYPYVAATASLAGMVLQACGLQVDNTQADHMQSCDQILPNTIDEDGGSWIFGVAGSTGLNQWDHQLQLPTGTKVLLWLTNVQGTLAFQSGNPVYRYDEAKHTYVKV